MTRPMNRTSYNFPRNTYSRFSSKGSFVPEAPYGETQTIKSPHIRPNLVTLGLIGLVLYIYSNN